MEWNWCWNGNINVTPNFLLDESSGDSEDVKSHLHHHHHHDEEDVEASMDESEGHVSFPVYDDVVDVDVDDDDDDDAQSCSYDHSCYINRGYGSSHLDQSQRLIYVDDDDDDDDDDMGDIYDDDDDDDGKNWGESKLMDSSKQQKRSQKCFVDSPNQREVDREFWEACLAS